MIELSLHIIIPSAVWLIYSIWIITFVNKQMGPGLQYIRAEDPQLAYKYDCFCRKDISRWNKCEIYFCALFFLPFRALQFFLSAFLCLLFLKLGLIGIDMSKQELSHFRRGYIKLVTRFFSRLCLYGLGFYYIKRVKLDIADFDPSYPKEKAANQKGNSAPIIVSNHVSFIDIFLQIYNPEVPSFVAKAAIKNYPIFGAGATALKTIFLQREDKDKRGDVFQQIRERVQEFNANPITTPPILIFPEGTTSNGEYMLSFKKGAFATATPLRMYGIKYTNKRFNPAFDTLGIGKLFLFTLLQFWNSVTIYDLGVYYPDHLNLKGDEDWTLYAEKIKFVYLKALGLKSSDMGYQDMVAYQKELMGDSEK